MPFPVHLLFFGITFDVKISALLYSSRIKGRLWFHAIPRHFDLSKGIKTCARVFHVEEKISRRSFVINNFIR